MSGVVCPQSLGLVGMSSDDNARVAPSATLPASSVLDADAVGGVTSVPTPAVVVASSPSHDLAEGRAGLAGQVAAANDHPPSSAKEQFSFIAYDWSNSAVSSIAVSGFLPLLVQDAAAAAAGFPDVCPNLSKSVSTIVALLGNATAATSAYLVAGLSPSSPSPGEGCVPLANTPGAVGCPGVPASTDYCRDASGLSVFPLRAGGVWDPGAYTNAMTSVGVALQMLVFIQLSGLADRGPYRLPLLKLLSNFGALLCVLALAVRPASWQWGGALLVLVPLVYSSSYVLYNSWLPLISANDPAVLALAHESKAAQYAAFESIGHDLSSRAYMWGYVGSILCLVIAFAVVAGLSSTLGAIAVYGIAIAISGVWWAGFSTLTWRHLLPRPGPALTAKETPFGIFVVQPWTSLFLTLSRARQLRQTFIFLVCWFIYSDGFNTVASAGIVYANSSVSWTGIDKTTGIALLLVIVPIFAALGNLFFNTLHKRGALSAVGVIVASNTLMALTPAYGLLGFASPALGYVRWYELYIGLIVYGFGVGASQSFSRSLLSALIPEGLEAQFWSLYSVTDRGSSWIGPAVIAAVLQSTGSVRLAFVYPLVTLLVPTLPLLLLDLPRGEREAAAAARAWGTARVALRGVLSEHRDADGGGAASIEAKSQPDCAAAEASPLTVATVAS